jgi:hypothetical protein
MMRDLFSAVGAVIFGIAVIMGISFLGYESYKFFAPRYEQVRYDTFKQSQAYNDGMLRDLYDLQREYNAADTEHRGAMKALIQHRFEVFDRNRLPNDLQVFYNSLGN